MTVKLFKRNTMRPHHPFVLTLFTVILVCTRTAINAANIPVTTTSIPEIESDVRVDCNNDEIVVSISTRSGRFNGMIYPAGLTKNSPCFGEWVQTSVPVKYKLPLRACNTMSMELDDGGIEYFNTIVVQPHLKLVTNQGRSFHIRCRYSTRNNTVTINDIDGPKLDYLHSEDTSIPPMPGCTMKIFTGDPSNKEVAENVKIGDPLSLQVSLDKQDTYGIRVTDCLVRDGIGSGEQKLINDDGCPLDSEIMGIFQYSEDKTTAIVKFQAHKFPSTESVYYQCNVKLCLKANGGCVEANPTACGSNRVRRQANNADSSEGTPATIEVYSGLYVNEANDLAKVDDDSVFSEKAPDDAICISQKNFAIGICVAGLILMLCAITAILCLLARRRPKKVSSNPSSSIYSGPYTNTAYSHSS
ncbi:hypothetical protein Trydic_g4194 [Trypoxylus dichotomus]